MRLRAWNTTSPDDGGNGDGEIPPSRSQRLAAARTEQLAAQRARAAARLAAAARGDAAHRNAATARANIRAALRATAANQA
jgi:hypothetical protein